LSRGRRAAGEDETRDLQSVFRRTKLNGTLLQRIEEGFMLSDDDGHRRASGGEDERRASDSRAVRKETTGESC